MVYRNRHSHHRPHVSIFVEGGDTPRKGCGRRKQRGWKMRHGRQHGRGQGHGRRRRPLGHGDLRLLLLSLISETPRHGYDLIREIEARTQGAYVPSPGVIYPALETLLDLGWAKAETEGSKRSFSVTPEGTEALDVEAETLEAIGERLADLSESERPDDPADVRGAMRRLRHAVITSVRQSQDEDKRAKIAAILASAQDEISRLD